MRLYRLLLPIVPLLWAASAQAYGPVGHQIVGAIADQRLANTPTGKKVAEMIDGFTLQKAAVIPDEIKGWDRKGADDPGIFHYTSRPRMDEQLRAFWRANPPTKDHESATPSHHWFHYTDVPVFADVKYADGKVGRGQWDIVHMMRYCIAVLRGEEPEENARKITKPIAIILLAHYVGDIHQPLHAGAEYFNAGGQPVDPDKVTGALEDQGGNTITLPMMGAKKKLHGYWDSETVSTFLPSLAGITPKDERRIENDAAIKTLTQKMATEEPKDWRLPANLKPGDYPEAWVNEILPLAREAHERLQFQNMRPVQDGGLIGGNAIEKPNKQNYRDWSAEVVRKELHKAGWRLADLLEKVLQAPGEKPPPSASATPTPEGSPSPAATISPPAEPPKIATITKPVPVRVPYGQAEIPAGAKLPYTVRGPGTVRVRYMGSEYDVPLASTDVP